MILGRLWDLIVSFCSCLCLLIFFFSLSVDSLLEAKSNPLMTSLPKRLGPDSNAENGIEDKFIATHASTRRKFDTLTESEVEALDDFQPDFWFEQSPEKDQEVVEEEGSRKEKEGKKTRGNGVGTGVVGRKTVKMVKKKKKEEVMGEEVTKNGVGRKDKGKEKEKERAG